MIMRIKSEYLDNRNIGIRRFAEMTGIRRNRLKRLFEGIESTTIGELDRINTTVNEIEAQHKKSQESKQVIPFKEEYSEKTIKKVSSWLGHIREPESKEPRVSIVRPQDGERIADEATV